MKHTKGPWHSTGFNIEVKEGLYYTLDNNSESSTPAEELRANASLISAAPELLSALEYLLSEAEHFGCGTAKESARKAIAKAKGDL